MIWPQELTVVAAFGVLGRTAVLIGGKLDEGWGAPQLRALLATLLINPGQRLPVGTIIEWVWPDEASVPRNPVSTIQSYATRIRRSLEGADVPATLIGEDGSYRLEVDRARIDIYHFRNLVADARAMVRHGKGRQAVTLATQAINLWRGRPLDDLSCEFAQAWRTHVVQDEWLPANALQLEAQLDLHEFNEVLARLNDLQADHPHDINLAKLRMSALHGLSRSSESDAYYFGVRRRLLESGDEQAADHLRHHQEQLRVRAKNSDSGLFTELAAVPHQLPHDLSDFIGRAGLLRELDAKSAKPASESGGTVVILDGMAGVGKTALAVHWGHLVRHRFPDGQFFTNLNGFSDSPAVTHSRVVDDFLIALGHPPDREVDQRTREQLLNRLLANRRTLVVLDNARDTLQVKELIALLTSSVVIVTSRQRLTTLSMTTGARRVRVEPMPDAEAAELLSAQLGEQSPIEEDDRTQLVRLSGGLPLVITMLADHIATSSASRPSGFAKQIDRRQLITDIGEDGDGSAVAHTVFSWSYQRLAPPERRLFRLLGLHPGPEIGVDVACACDGRIPAETKQSFGKLVGAHLLERPVVLDRYQFHDLIREFAIYCAERDEPPDLREAAERRVLNFYLHSAEHANRMLYPHRLTLDGLPPTNGVEPVTFSTVSQAKLWFDQERTNLISAVQFAAAKDHHDHAWRLADAVATFFDRHGYYQDSLTVRELAATSARAAGHREGEISSIEGIGMVHLILGNHAQAQRCLDISLRNAVAEGYERAQATTLHLLGRLEMQRGNPAAAVNYYLRCLDIARRIGDESGQCWSLCRAGEALLSLGRHNEALVRLHEARWFAQRTGDDSAHASSMATIGAVYRDKDDHHTAMAYAKEALIIAEAIPDLAITVQVCVTLAEIANERGHADALGYARRAVEVCRHTHNVSAEAHAREVLGDIQFEAGTTVEAIEAWQQAADLYDRIGNPGRSVFIQTKIDQNFPPENRGDL